MPFPTGYTCILPIYTKEGATHIGNLMIVDAVMGTWSYVPDPQGPYQPPHLLGTTNNGTTEWVNNIWRLQLADGKLFGALYGFSFIGNNTIGDKYIFENADGQFDAKFYKYSNVPQGINAVASAGQSMANSLSGFVVRV